MCITMALNRWNLFLLEFGSNLDFFWGFFCYNLIYIFFLLLLLIFFFIIIVGSFNAILDNFISSYICTGNIDRRKWPTGS